MSPITLSVLSPDDKVVKCFGPSLANRKEIHVTKKRGFRPIFKSNKQEQIVLERSARLNLDPGRGD